MRTVPPCNCLPYRGLANVPAVLAFAAVLVAGVPERLDGQAQPATAFPVADGTTASQRIALTGALREHPRDAHVWYELGLLDGRLHNFSAAEQEIRKSLAFDATVPETHYLLGLSLVANPKAKLDWPGAIEQFRIALKLRPGYADAANYLGVGLTAMGQYDAAVDSLQNAVRLAPTSASARFNLALALEPLQRDTEAAAAYRHAIALRPGFAEAHSAFGKLLLRTENGAAAEHELRAALRSNPDLQDAHYALGQALRTNGHEADAKAEFDIALALGQREPDGIASSQKSNAAMHEAEQGNLAGAEIMLLEAVRLRPDYGVPHYNLGLILADRGQWDDAVSQLAQAASLTPAQAAPWFDLGRVFRKQGRVAESISCLRWAVALDPGERHVRELRDASTQFQLPMQGTPELPPFGVTTETASAFVHYAAELEARRDLIGAVGMLLHALVLAPEAIQPRLQLAAVYVELEDIERSRQEYSKVLATEPENPVARDFLEGKSLVSPQ